MPPVNYVEAARRHQRDSQVLDAQSRSANAGQLLGFSMECGLKALLVAARVPTDQQGSVTGKFRQHLPELDDRIAWFGHLIPDGREAATYLSLIPSRASFQHWSVDQRYWSEADLLMPLQHLPDWATAVEQMNQMLDQVILDGVLAWPY